MKQVGNSHYSVDRFIPRRCINSELNQYNLIHTEDYLSSTPIENKLLNETFINTARYANIITNYRKLLLQSVYQCLPNAWHQMPNLETNEKILSGGHTWPVYPRKKPLINRPVTVLDMPDMSTTVYHHVIDWGKKGHLATIFHNEVYLWPFQDSQLDKTDTCGSVLDCVKWNKSGTHFAVSRTHSRFTIIDGETLKMINNFKCKCFNCVITAIEWTNKDVLVAGCSKGSINVVLKNAFCVEHFHRALDDEIVDLKLSCNDRFLTICGMSGTCIMLKLPEMEKLCCLSSNGKGRRRFIKTTAWHPWKESILAVGDLTNTISIWNIVSQKLIDRNVPKPFFRDEHIVDCLTFNPLSAELLVSFYCEAPDPDTSLGYNFLTIFSDIRTIVDELKFHNARVPFALWDGTGTKLATVSADENLAIWEFFGEEASEFQGKRRKQKQSIFNVFQNERRFNMCLR